MIAVAFSIILSKNFLKIIRNFFFRLVLLCVIWCYFVQTGCILIYLNMLNNTKKSQIISNEILLLLLQNRVPRVQVLLPLPSKNGLNTAFKPFFDIFLCTEHGLIFPFWCSILASKCSTGANNSNVSVCYIINIASIS